MSNLLQIPVSAAYLRVLTAALAFLGAILLNVFAQTTFLEEIVKLVSVFIKKLGVHFFNWAISYSFFRLLQILYILEP